PQPRIRGYRRPKFNNLLVDALMPGETVMDLDKPGFGDQVAGKLGGMAAPARAIRPHRRSIAKNFERLQEIGNRPDHGMMAAASPLLSSAEDFYVQC
ncbi:MAG: hypothetical protein ACOYLQ_20035, partial [Hyphomicrobiaceae bacterium]